MKPLLLKFWSKVNITPTCWLWTGSTNRHTSSSPREHKWPYGQLNLMRNGKRVKVQAHRVSWELEHGPIPKGLWILHKCDNTLCVRPDHLFLGTPKVNTDDMRKKKRDLFWGGEERPRKGRPKDDQNIILCASCSNPFLPGKKHRKTAKYCSPDCAQDARRGATYKLSPEALASFREKRGFSKPPEVRNCELCGAPFTVDLHHKAQRFCSKTCSNKHNAPVGRKLSPEALASFREKRGWTK